MWSFPIFKGSIRFFVNRNDYLKEKLYKDLRYEGIMSVDIMGRELKIFNPGFSTLENEIYWNGLEGWEKHTVKLWIDLCKNATSTIVDIGANSGVFSLIANTVNDKAIVIAYEPVQRTLELFKKNLDLNPGLKIAVSEKAISNNNGEATFYDVKSDYQYSASLNKDMFKEINDFIEYKVPVTTLDDELYALENKIDLIKLDIELHEPEAIEGMMNILKRDKPTIIVEILNDKIGERIERLIKELGYLYYAIDEKNGYIKTVELKKSPSYNYLICTPEKAKELKL